MIQKLYQITVLFLYGFWIKLQEIQFQIIYLLCDFKDTIIDSKRNAAVEGECKRSSKKPKHISLLFNPKTLKTLLRGQRDASKSLDESLTTRSISIKEVEKKESIEGLVDLILQIINYTKSSNEVTTISLYDQFGRLIMAYCNQLDRHPKSNNRNPH